MFETYREGTLYRQGMTGTNLQICRYRNLKTLSKMDKVSDILISPGVHLAGAPPLLQFAPLVPLLHHLAVPHPHPFAPAVLVAPVLVAPAVLVAAVLVVAVLVVAVLVVAVVLAVVVGEQ